MVFDGLTLAASESLVNGDDFYCQLPLDRTSTAGSDGSPVRATAFDADLR
jgi:hypothetical protein